MMRAVVIDGRGQRRGVWGTSLGLVGKEQPLDAMTEQSIIDECQKYLDSQWRDSDTARLYREMRRDSSLRFARFQQITGRLSQLPKRWLWIVAIILIGTYAIVAVFLPVLAMRLVGVLLFGTFYTIVIATFVWSGISRGSPRKQWPDVPMRVRAAVMVNHGHCADCGYSIKGLPPEADGCCVCPECGAAWKLPQST